MLMGLLGEVGGGPRDMFGRFVEGFGEVFRWLLGHVLEETNYC